MRQGHDQHCDLYFLIPYQIPVGDVLEPKINKLRFNENNPTADGRTQVSHLKHALLENTSLHWSFPI